MQGLVAASVVGTTLWWIGLAVLAVVVIPIVLFVALTLVRTIAEIGRYAVDIRTHGVGLAEAVGNLEPLATTPRLAAEAGDGISRYARAWQRTGGAP